MGDTNTPQESLRLSRLYQSMGDIELLQLRDAFDDLTDTARDALSRVLAARGLVKQTIEEAPPTPERGALDPPSEIPSQEDLILEGVSVAECQTTSEAELLGFVLDDAGVPNAILPIRGKFYATFPQIRVSPDDVDRAQAIIGMPISESVRRQFEQWSDDNARFADLRCPRCRSSDVMLQPEKPGYLNDWSCLACSHQWQDALPEDSEREGRTLLGSVGHAEGASK